MRIRASTQAGVTAFRDLVKLLSELPDHIPPEINAASFVRFSAVPFAANCRLPRDFELLRIVVHADESRRGLERIVQPHPQIPIEEQLLPQQSGQRR